MEGSEQSKPTVEAAGEDLFNFAVDREDTKILMAHLPEEAGTRRITVEYELPILKIISVGWGISYYLGNSPYKDLISEQYWKAIYEFSQNLSETTELMIGQDIDYFQILKDRLDMYVDAMSKNPEAQEPAAIIGPEFARTCGNADDVYAVMTGSRMFISTIGRVKEYLEGI
jgi:hypothetical protein